MDLPTQFSQEKASKSQYEKNGEKKRNGKKWDYFSKKKKGCWLSVDHLLLVDST